MSQQSEIRTLVRSALSHVAEVAYPNFYKMIQTVDGYKKAEDLILNYAIKNQISVSSAIGLLEAELEM